MRQFSKSALSVLETPHQKPQLSTRIGRAAERISYVDLLFLTMLVLSLSSTYFVFGGHGHTLSKGGDAYETGFLEAIYFCIVTFTSLGYGDLAPIGFGRLIASLLVFWGLATIALVIGKVASERSQTTLLLLHRSDVEKRISGFTKEFFAFEQNASNLLNQHDISSLDELISEIVDGHQAMNRYLIFHANQSTAVADGNEGALSSLLSQLVLVQKACVQIHKEANQIQARKLARLSFALTYRLHWTARFLCEQYNEAASKRSLSQAFIAKLFRRQMPERPFSKSASRIVMRMEENLNALEKWRSTAITIDTLDAVYELMPVGPKSSWPKYVNKDIAEKLGTSKSRITRHVDQLIKEGALPK